jgi:MoaA/NifB/PqqE/SkfB family radical SAM enzyme
VYQVEVASGCVLACPLCHRADAVAERDTDRRLLDPADLAGWLDRGDFDGSYFVELQMAGEPLLHPALPAITRMLRDRGLIVGLSTNGVLLEQHIERVRGVDAITVSVDAMDPDRYAAIRPRRDGPGDWDDMARGVDTLLRSDVCPRFVDLQLVAPLGTPKGDVEAELARVRERWPDGRVTARWVWDCFAVEMGRADFRPDDELCLNPWTSVSVQCDGTVVSCCYVWGRTPPNVYGNLNDRSLLDVWNGSQAAALRQAHRNGRPGGWCTRCYLRSPYLLHLGFVPTWTRRTR